MDPAVAGTLNILKTAQNISSIKRVVITSSIGALFPVDGVENEIIDHNSRPVFIPGPYPNQVTAYKASRVAALNYTEIYMAENKPSFEITNILPRFVIEKDKLVISADEIALDSNGLVMGLYSGISPQFLRRVLLSISMMLHSFTSKL